MEGYISKKPDSNWWLEQIKAGEEYREKKAETAKWDTYRSYYRGDWKSGVMPVNLFFTLIRTIVPRVYFRNPAVSISPGSPGFESMIFSKVLERVDNKVLRDIKAKKAMKRGIQDAFMFGTGVAKLGFGGIYNPTGSQSNGMFDKSNNLVEYTTSARDQMPWLQRVNPGNFVVPAGLEDYDSTRWVAEEIWRPVEDIRDDKRMENTARIGTSEHYPSVAGNIPRKIKMAKLYEVYDRKTGKVFIIAPDHGADDKIILYQDSAILLQGRTPYFPIQFNDDDERFWAIADSKILEPYQLDINEARTQIMQHRRLTLVKILAKRKGISLDDAERMISEDVSAVVWVDGEGPIGDNIKLTQGGTIPPELFNAVEATRQDVRETIGFSRNQQGEFNSRSGDTTATEANIVREAVEIRVDERRDITADVLTDIVETMHPIIFDNWGAEQVVDIVGPGGLPVWVRMSQESLRTGRFNTKIDPESSVPETRALRERRAMELYQVMKTNPLLDPIKLTQYLLNELKGTQFDDMMRMLPPPAGGAPNGPVAPGQLAQMIAGSMQQAGSGALPVPSGEG